MHSPKGSEEPTHPWAVNTESPMIKHLCFSLLVLFAALAAVPSRAWPETVDLKVGGTGNALGTVRLLAKAFEAARPGVRVVILESIGSSGAIKGTMKGGVDVGLSARPLTQEEMESGIRHVEFARTPTLFAVHSRSSASAASLREIADIYAGRLPRWPDGSLIRPVLRQPGDDNTKQIKALSPDIEQALLLAEQRQGLPFAVTDQEAADKIEGTQGGLGVTTLALIRSESRGLKGLALDGAEPTVENALSGRYPLLKHLYFVLPKAPRPEALDFVAFTASPEGRRILEENGSAHP